MVRIRDESHFIDTLLAQPFDQVLLERPELRSYIEENPVEDPEELMQEFREHWGPAAPEELRKALEDILTPGTSTEGAEGHTVDSLLCESFEVALQRFPPLLDYINCHDNAAVIMDNFQKHWSTEAPAELREALDLLLKQPRGNIAALEDDDLLEDPEIIYDTTQLDRQVSRLLQRPFEEALRSCPALQQHIAAQADNSKTVEAAFCEAWSATAQPELREALAKILRHGDTLFAPEPAKVKSRL